MPTDKPEPDLAAILAGLAEGWIYESDGPIVVAEVARLQSALAEAEAQRDEAREGWRQKSGKCAELRERAMDAERERDEATQRAERAETAACALEEHSIRCAIAEQRLGRLREALRHLLDEPWCQMKRDAALAALEEA